MKNITSKQKVRLFGLINVVVLLLMTTSCKKNLELNPLSSYNGDSYFTTVGTADLATLGIYAALESSKSLYNSAWIIFEENTDEDRMSASSIGDNERNDLGNYAITPTNTMLPDIYTNLYNIIAKANLCIDRISQMDLYKNGKASEIAALNKNIAEAVFLRSYSYFELIKHWGDVPYTIHYQDLTGDLNLPRVSRDTIYDHCIKEMLVYVDSLPISNNIERLTKYAGKGLLARICLHAAGYSLRWNLETNDAASLVNAQRADAARITELYTIAYNQTNDIITSGQFSLYTDYGTVFKALAVDELAYKESLFEVAFSYQAEKGSSIGIYNSIAVLKGIVKYTGGTDAKISGYVNSLPTLYLAYNDNDQRKPYAGTFDYIVDSNDSMAVASTGLWGISVGKFRRDWINTSAAISSSSGDFNKPMLRYSDVLLMNAEADNELNHGPSQDAINRFNLVRLRAFAFDSTTSGIASTPTDYTGFFNAIVDERAFELCHEGLRKSDLIRWNLLSTKIYETERKLASLLAQTDEYDGQPEVMYYIWNPETKKLVIQSTAFTLTYNTKKRSSLSFPWSTSIDLTQYCYGFTPLKTEILPLPQSYTQVNPKLKQCPAYLK